MRVGIWIGALLLASPALAGSPHATIVPRDPFLPHWNVARYSPADSQADRLPDFARLGGPDPSANSPQGLSLGPIHAESETINGHRRVHYRMDGITFLGGDIGGSMSHGGAMLTLHWQTSGQ